MKKKPRKTKLPRCLEKIVRAPASLPPEFINEIMTEIVRAHGKITAEMKEEVDRIVKRQQEKHVRQMMALKLKALLGTTAYRKTPPARAGGWPVSWLSSSFPALHARIRPSSLSARRARLLMRSW
jgi:hypothetical protein